jgi:hypothetical protein
MTLATTGQSLSLVEPVLPQPSPALPERLTHVQKMLAVPWQEGTGRSVYRTARSDEEHRGKESAAARIDKV